MFFICTLYFDCNAEVPRIPWNRARKQGRPLQEALGANKQGLRETGERRGRPQTVLYDHLNTYEKLPLVLLQDRTEFQLTTF